MCSTQKKDSGDQNPGVYIPDCVLASLRKRHIAACILPPFLWILYFSWLRGVALMGRGKISQPGEPITGCSMAQQSQGERCCWITPGDQQGPTERLFVWKTGRHHPATLSKEANTALFEKSQNCHMSDSRAPEVFRCLLPHGNLCKIHFVDEAVFSVAGCADIDWHSACHLISEKGQLSVPCLHCTAYWHVLVTIFHVTLHKEDKVSHDQFK